MATKNRSLPAKGAELGPFATRFVEVLEALPGDYHTGPERTARLKALVTVYDQKYAAQLAAQDAARTATNEKDVAQTELLDELASISRFVKGNDEVSNASLERLGLPPRSTSRTPVPRPTEYPLADVINTACLEHTLMIINPESKTRRAKPAGVVGCEIHVAVAAAVPTRETDYRFVALATRSTEVVTFQDGEGGQAAHYRLRWVNTRGEAGPFSPVFSATIPAV
ncbi:MAG: hypothetical protein R3C59_03795 [Planctomycetaceae bacterium]